MDRLLRADGAARLEEACGSSEVVPPVLERLALDDWRSRMPEDLASTRVDDVPAVTDMGLLERMVREGLAEPERGFPRLGAAHRRAWPGTVPSGLLAQPRRLRLVHAVEPVVQHELLRPSGRP
jgi:hypothetical protein